MKNEKTKYRDFEIKFWKDWIEADHLKRFELVETLPAFKMCLSMKDNKIWRRSFALLLNSFFEDLESAVYTKIRLEKKIIKQIEF
ncbi:MAG: hypothetical protein KKE23_03520 [Nanoarchaeota archaeon]|nr:hypothetical protein [Nanoarchaeota archaeon]